MSRIKIITGDITTLHVDAIVNAANETLLGGGGVDGAIHRAAGPALLAACREIPEVNPGIRCPTGEARITPGFRLPAKYVIHTVGPVFDERNKELNDITLGQCYLRSLRLAADNKAITIAFPAISTGVFGFPKERAAMTAYRIINWYMAEQHEFPQEVTLVFSDEHNRHIFLDANKLDYTKY